MISISKGGLSYSGNKIVLMAEFTTLIHALYKDVLSKDEIEECVKLAFLSTDDLDKMVEDERVNVDSETAKKISKLLDDILSD